MRLRVPRDQVSVLSGALKRAASKEIGGQIFGEQLAPSDFRVMELTLQKRLGTFARFIVDLWQAARDAARFFDQTGHRYTRFNYIGEWHSHPSFDVWPSGTDVTSMRRLVSDPGFRGSFAVLMIVRLDEDRPTCGAWLFDRQGPTQSMNLELEE